MRSNVTKESKRPCLATACLPRVSGPDGPAGDRERLIEPANPQVALAQIYEGEKVQGNLLGFQTLHRVFKERQSLRGPSGEDVGESKRRRAHGNEDFEVASLCCEQGSFQQRNRIKNVSLVVAGHTRGQAGEDYAERVRLVGALDRLETRPSVRDRFRKLAERAKADGEEVSREAEVPRPAVLHRRNLKGLDGRTLGGRHRMSDLRQFGDGAYEKLAGLAKLP